MKQLPALLRQLKIPPRGIIHVGAHLGEEVPIYRRAGFRKIVLVEPNPDLVRQMDHPGVVIHECACAAYPGKATLHLGQKTKLSSLYVPINRVMAGEIEVEVRLMRDLQDGCNVAVIDAQGAELEVATGADLGSLDLIVMEARTVGMYGGCPSIDEAVGWMRRHGWKEVARWPHPKPPREPQKLYDLVFAKK